MNIVKANEAARFENSSACAAFEYSQPTDALDMARIEWSVSRRRLGIEYNMQGDSVCRKRRGKTAIARPDDEHGFW